MFRPLRAGACAATSRRPTSRSRARSSTCTARRRGRRATGRPMRAGERGFTYVWAMAAVAILGVGMAAMGSLWSDDARREREQEALRIGRLYAEAIESYYRASP